MLLTAQELAQAAGGELVAGDGGFSSVCIDSRKALPQSLFVAMKGESADGHDFIEAALKKGAACVLCEKNFARENGAIGIWAKKFGAAFVACESSMRGLQNASAFYVAKFPRLKKVAVTGSAGKTTTKELVVSVLRQKFRVVANEGNLNSETGLPLSVFKIQAEDEIGVFEMGMNRKGEIAELADVLRPDVAVITNIGTAHIGKIGSRKAIAFEKKQAFKNFDENCVALIPEEDDFRDFLRESLSCRVGFFGLKTVADIKDLGIDGSEFSIDGIRARLKIPGRHALADACAAIEVGKRLGLSARQIACGLEKAEALSGRGKICRGEFLICDDSYNANLDSMLSAIDFWDSAEIEGRKIFVVGDMLELGENSRDFHLKVAQRLAKSRAALCVGFGGETCAAFEKAGDERFKAAESLDEIHEILRKTVKKGDLVFFKASNGMRLFEAASRLSAECNRGGENA